MTTKSGWRKVSRRIILRVLEETKGKSEREIREALLKAYPFGERKYYPYKIWLEEVKACRKDFNNYQQIKLV